MPRGVYPRVKKNTVRQDYLTGRFVRLAKKRSDACMNKIRLISNLSNRASYSYTPEQVDALFKSLRNALDEAQAKFRK